MYNLRSYHDDNPQYRLWRQLPRAASHALVVANWYENAGVPDILQREHIESLK